jgi:4,5-DOPA dioxygenase extradiol
MTSSPKRMPVVFVGHGSPMNALEDNPWSRGFHELGGALPRPAAILAVSAHWFLPGTFVTDDERPKTLHDFGGFPDALYALQYPARGDAALANEIAERLSQQGHPASTRSDWGLDHGTWSVLRHLRPQADVPVLQLSIDSRLAPAAHVAIGRALAPLRERGVMILASGNIVHNLRDALGRMHTRDLRTPEWATRFDAHVRDAILRHDAHELARLSSSDDGRKAHPSPDHYYPLLYAAGGSDASDAPAFPVLGFDLGSLSMRCVVWR